MKTSKTLTSAIVATALVGAIGMAYAQTSDTTQPMTPDTSGQAVQNQPSSDTTGAPASTDTSFQTERPAQADRN